MPPVARVVDHIDHIVKLVGVNHVGVGSDFDGIQATPEGLSAVADLPNLTAELLRRGYTEEDVTKILGGNILRVMEEVERVQVDEAERARNVVARRHNGLATPRNAVVTTHNCL